MPEKLLNIEEVAKYLGISEKGVEALVVRGKLTAYKIGGTFLRFKPEQVEVVKNAMHLSSPKPRLSESVIDFFYFNDFYIIAILFIIGLIFFILFF